MRIRVFLPLVAALIVSLTAISCAAAAVEPFVLENDRVLIEVGQPNGAVARVLDKASKIELAPPKSLAGNFQLVLLKPDKTTATIVGRDQKLTGARVGDGEMTLTWSGPLKDDSGEQRNILVRMLIRLDGPTARFALHVENNTDLKMREASYPMIGGVSEFGAPGMADGSVWVPTTTPWQKPARLPFGSHGFGYPSQMNMSFACVQSKSAGKTLYLASEDEIARYKLYHFIEEAAGDENDLFVCLRHHPFIAPGAKWDGPSAALRVVDGDWRAAGKVYREWFIRTFGIAQPHAKDNWIRDESFFVMTMFMLPEGTITMRFKDIPAWARSAKACGINAVQISGWQMGGHDNGYPHYVPDPRLGTWKELEDGIRACHEMGMKVYFFVNYQPVMVESNWYKQELQKYREMTADGGNTWMAGWGMGTLWARMGNPKLMTWASPAFPQFRKIIVDQFAALAKIGADGVHVDKMFPAAIDYNPDLPMSPDSAAWEGAILLTKEVMAECRKHNPLWSMSFETNWDRMLQFGGATWWVGNQLQTRLVFPEHAETLGLYQAYDYIGLNNAVRGGHVVMVAPMNFCRPLDWEPFRGLGAYIKQVKAIRDRLQDTVFHGEVLGQAGVKLAGPVVSGIDYNVFRNQSNGGRVAIFTNSHSEPRKQIIEGFDGKPGASARVHIPGKESFVVRLPGAIEVPAERIAFVEEIAGESERTGRSDTPVGQGTASSDRSVRPTGARLSDKSVRPTDAGLSDKSVRPTGAGAPDRSVRPTGVENGAFESNTFEGWVADPNWKIMDNGLAWYSGWQGKYWAWSGGTGEAAVGKLRSKPFILDKGCVRMMVSGWSSVRGTGSPRRWNYVTLNLEDGTEIDRVWAPDTTQFVSAFLDGSKHKGKRVYIEAVDDADQETFSMLCIDDVRTASLPASYVKPVPAIPAFDAKKSIRLEDENCVVDVSRENGSVIRVFDKKGKLELILEPRLAGSYRFALVLPGREPWQTIEANWIFGKQQKLSSHSLEDKKLTLRWDAPVKNYLGAKYGASVTETIELRDGGVLFSLSIDNETPYQIGEVYFPVLGGIQGLGGTYGLLRSTEMIRPSADSVVSAGIFRVFNNMSWLGDQGPEQFYAYPDAQPEPWLAFHQPRLGRSVYIGAHDPGSRKQVIRMELVPASSGVTRDDGNWPRPEELNGEPCGVELSFVEIANYEARKAYQAAPVFLKFHDGGSKESRVIYSDWRQTK